MRRVLDRPDLHVVYFLALSVGPLCVIAVGDPGLALILSPVVLVVVQGMILTRVADKGWRYLVVNESVAVLATGGVAAVAWAIR